MKTTEEKIKELFEKIEQLKKEAESLKQTERWQDKLVQPSEDDYYFLGNGISSSLDVMSQSCSKRKPEHAFKTEQQAELMKQKLLLHMEMAAFVHVRNNGWEADWAENTSQEKFGIEHIKGKSYINKARIANTFVFGLSVKSVEIAREMLSIFDERIEKYYNVQY